MTPTWAVILVGLGSAVIGSLFTTLATISHERAAELRTRMLNAADEFSTGASAALQQMYVAANEIRREIELGRKGSGKRSKATPVGEERGFSPEIQAHLHKVDEAVDDAAAKQARIFLLFGNESPAGEAATHTMGHLRGAKWLLRDLEQTVRFDETHSSAYAQHQRFNRVALEAIERSFPSWHRYWERRRLRREAGK
jgi:hypothetical protein